MLIPTWDSVRRSAESAGRDPEALRMVMRANPIITGESEGTPPGSGTVAQIADHLNEAAAAGVHEIFLDFQLTARDDQHLLKLAEEFRSHLT